MCPQSGVSRAIRVGTVGVGSRWEKWEHRPRTHSVSPFGSCPPGGGELDISGSMRGNRVLMLCRVLCSRLRSTAASCVAGATSKWSGREVVWPHGKALLRCLPAWTRAVGARSRWHCDLPVSHHVPKVESRDSNPGRLTTTLASQTTVRLTSSHCSLWSETVSRRFLGTKSERSVWRNKGIFTELIMSALTRQIPLGCFYMNLKECCTCFHPMS